MDNIIKTLNGMEELIIKLVKWVISIPRTILWIIFTPDEVPVYIDQINGDGKAEGKGSEENKQKKPGFEGLLHPVALLLAVALIPALLFSFVPPSDVTISKPAAAEAASEESNLPSKSSLEDTYQVTANFVLPAGESKYKFDWWVEKITDNGFETIDESWQTHSELDETGKKIKLLDNNTVEDLYSFQFPEPGDYYVNVTVSRVYPDDERELISYTTYVLVNVTAGSNQELTGRIEESSLKISRDGIQQNLTLDSFSSSLKKESTIFLAIGLLLPPLFFAFVALLVTQRAINEKSLKETFYAKCYYFSPLSLAIWAFYYSLKYFTNNVFYHWVQSWVIYLPLILAVIWFIVVETKALADVNQEDKINRPKAFLIVSFCLIVLSASAALIFTYRNDFKVQEFVRLNLIRLYVLVGLSLIVTYIVKQTKIRLPKKSQPAEQKGKPKLTFRRIIVPLSALTLALCCLFTGWLFLSPVDQQSPDAASTIETPTGMAPVNISIPEAQVNYTEELIGKIDNWGPLFMTNGEESQVNLSGENGGLRFKLSQKEGQTPQAYFINTAATYTDVQVETIAKNNGNNSNGISLICRLNDKGWYEFEVSNAGHYTIYAFDAIDWSYSELASDTSEKILPGLSENKIAAVCKDSELSLLVNNETVATVQDTKYNFADGNIGIALYSPEGMPVDVNFESVKVSGQATVLETTDQVDADLPTTEATPAENPIPESPLFYAEEFEGSLDNWVTIGDESQLKLPPENGSLHFQLSQKDGRVPSVYLINDAAVYGDVQVEVVTTNNGNNSNGVDLVCQANENGWYEFEVSNSGEYNIFAWDEINRSYTTLFSGSSAAVNTGLSQNTYTAVCKGNELTLIINGTPVETITETDFNFMEGRVGFGVSSRQGYPVDLLVESVRVSEP